MSNKVNWFEIPVANLERAVKFYGEVFQKEMKVFEVDEKRTIEPLGSLLHTANFEPSHKGTIVYLDPMESLDVLLGRVEAVGGKVTFPKFRIGHGYLATFIDSEGNTVGLLEEDKE
jgi:predicted enzyme related to lactoylglutathione lyase